MGNETKKIEETNGKKTVSESKTPVIPITKAKEKTLQELLFEKLSKISVFQKLSNKLDTYKATKEKLKNFELKSDQYEDMLTIRDSQRNEFKTSNSEIVKKVVEVLNSELDIKISETELQIREATL